MNQIRKENLKTALAIAIHALALQERRWGENFKSCLRAGFEENLKKLENGEEIIIT